VSETRQKFFPNLKMARTKQTMGLNTAKSCGLAKQLFQMSPATSIPRTPDSSPLSPTARILSGVLTQDSPIVESINRNHGTPEPYLKRRREHSPFEELKEANSQIGKSRRVDPQEWLDAQSPIYPSSEECVLSPLNQTILTEPTELVDTPVSSSESDCSFDYDLNSEEEDLLEQICLCLPTRMCTFCRMRGVIDLTNDE